MNHFTCDSCHYIFQAEDIPSSCPSCGASSVFASNSTGKKFNIPAIRLSTEGETRLSQQADTEKAAEKSYLERIDSLNDYNLSDDEYHLALMLLFYFKSSPKEFASIHLNHLLSRKNPSSENAMDEDGTYAGELYTKVRKHFVSQIGRERQETGCNDAAEVAAYTEKGSAADLLTRFRQDEWDQILCKIPNLTNIRSVKIDHIAKKPGENYLRFLMDWHNSIQN